MVVDVQCVMQALVELSRNFHTQVITTSPKVQIKGAVHIEFDEHRALTVAKQILKTAIDNYKNRGKTHIPQVVEDLVPGFSHEYINYMLGGTYRASFRPLNDAIMSGRIRVAASWAATTHAASRTTCIRMSSKSCSSRMSWSCKPDAVRLPAQSSACCSARPAWITSVLACAICETVGILRCCIWALASTIPAS